MCVILLLQTLPGLLRTQFMVVKVVNEYVKILDAIPKQALHHTHCLDTSIHG